METLDSPSTHDSAVQGEGTGDAVADARGVLDEGAGHTVVDQLGHGPDGRGHDRRATHHGLGQHETEGLGE